MSQKGRPATRMAAMPPQGASSSCLHASFPHFYKLELIKREKFKPILHKFVYHFLV